MEKPPVWQAAGQQVVQPAHNRSSGDTKTARRGVPSLNRRVLSEAQIPGQVSLSEALVVLQVNESIQLELALNIPELLGIGFEDVVHIMPPLKVTGVVCELPAAHLLDLIKLGAFRFHLLGDGSNEFVDTIFLSLRVQNNQAFVFPVHPLVSWVAILDRVLIPAPSAGH